VGFYTEVLGGDLITHPTQGIEIMQDDSAHWMILANESIEAIELAARQKIPRDQAYRQLAVADISKSGHARLDHRFVLFDNFVVEPLEYTDGLTFGASGFDPHLGHSTSPAFIGTVTAAFGGLPSSGDAQSNDVERFISDTLKPRAKRQGFADLIKLPSKVARFEDSHPLAGLEYAYAKGPDGEAIVLANIIPDRPFSRRLHDAVLEAGGVSTLWPDTNIHAKGDMTSFCGYAQGIPQYQSFEF